MTFRIEFLSLVLAATAGAVAVDLGGCAAAPLAPRAAGEAGRAADAPPRPGVPPPAPPSPTAAALPVYRNPTIGVVYLRPHQDATGRLFGPQVMYQVTDPGGWNVEAVEQGRGYIPSVNLEVPPNAGYPFVAPARAVPPLPADAPLLDPTQAARITVTGLMRPEDQARAEALAGQAGGGRSAVFDREAGWLLIPPR